MKEVKYQTEEVWVWYCPECGNRNEEDEDPGCEVSLCCGQCGEEFEPVEK